MDITTRVWRRYRNIFSALGRAGVSARSRARSLTSGSDEIGVISGRVRARFGGIEIAPHDQGGAGDGCRCFDGGLFKAVQEARPGACVLHAEAEEGAVHRPPGGGKPTQDHTVAQPGAKQSVEPAPNSIGTFEAGRRGRRCPGSRRAGAGRRPRRQAAPARPNPARGAAAPAAERPATSGGRARAWIARSRAGSTCGPRHAAAMRASSVACSGTVPVRKADRTGRGQPAGRRADRRFHALSRWAIGRANDGARPLPVVRKGIAAVRSDRV